MVFVLLYAVNGNIGFVLGEPTGIDFFIPSGKQHLDFQAGLSSFHWGYIGAFGGLEFDISSFGDMSPEFKNLVLYFKPGACANIGIWSTWYRDFLLIGGTGRIGLKLNYQNFQFFIETGPALYVVMDFFLDWGGVIGFRIIK